MSVYKGGIKYAYYVNKIYDASITLHSVTLLVFYGEITPLHIKYNSYMCRFIILA